MLALISPFPVDEFLHADAQPLAACRLLALQVPVGGDLVGQGVLLHAARIARGFGGSRAFSRIVWLRSSLMSPAFRFQLWGPRRLRALESATSRRHRAIWSSTSRCSDENAAEKSVFALVRDPRHSIRLLYAHYPPEASSRCREQRQKPRSTRRSVGKRIRCQLYCGLGRQRADRGMSPSSCFGSTGEIQVGDGTAARWRPVAIGGTGREIAGH